MFDIADILEADTLDEAFELLKSNPKLKIIAGGTDVLIRARHGSLEGAKLLSLRNIKGLDEIKLLEDGTVSIGAMATFSKIFRDEIINRCIPFLAEAAAAMGGPQIRNVATIGGNICNGAVSADSATTLLALNAVLDLESAAGKRTVALQDFYEGPGRVRLQPGEILTAIRVVKENYFGMYGHYIKYSNRKALDIAMLGVSVVCRADNGRFGDLRIALGVAAPTPVRCTEAEEYAKGRDITEETIKEIGRYALKSSKARDSWRASKAYREHLIETLTQRGIRKALEKGGGGLIG